MSGGDARQAIAMIENTISLYKNITVESLKNTLQSKFLRYDKKTRNITILSVLFKKYARFPTGCGAVLYVQNVESGEDPKYIARRMVVFASEDIGLAQPTALGQMRSFKQLIQLGCQNVEKI